MQVAGEFQRQIDDLIGADADLLQRELRPPEPGRHAADDRRHALHRSGRSSPGFFGQNFGWLVDNIDTKHDFLIYGVGGITVPTVILLTLFWVKRRDWF